MTVEIVLLTDLRTKSCMSSAKDSDVMLYLDVIEPMSAVYKRNSDGPSTEPCGTPQLTRVEGDVFPAK